MTKRKKVLIIGMLNSIHFSNWLIRFKDEEVDFFIFPSRQYRNLDPQLRRLISEKNNAKFQIVRRFPLVTLRNYIDFVLETRWLNGFFPNFRLNALGRFISTNSIDFIHCLEIQSAGYLVSELDPELLVNSEVIVTNWGSDIYYFARFEEHEKKIRKVLALTDRYSAECFRDYELATKYGFKGAKLPVIPNSFYNNLVTDVTSNPVASSRKWIIVKGYGGQFGQIQIVIESVARLLKSGTNFQFFFYSITPDVESCITKLQLEYPNKIEFISIENKISKSAMADWFSKSRIYIGCSKSDGVSTSFLEALHQGAYPIQTNTSCASEWVLKGAVASIIDVTEIDLSQELLRATKDDELVDYAQSQNRKIALMYLNPSELLEKSKLFYNL